MIADRDQRKQVEVYGTTKKHLKDKYDLSNNEVDENGDAIPLFITQIKEKFNCIDKKFEMIQMKVLKLCERNIR